MRATLIGALILFLIGLAVATCLNYTQASLNSIKAGLSGPYPCTIESQQDKMILCNETGKESLQSCIYVFVSYEDEETGILTENIKFSYTYLQEHTEKRAGREHGPVRMKYHMKLNAR